MSTFILTDTAENLWCEKVTIASGASKSEPVTTQGHALVGVYMPAAWTAANLGFEASLNGDAAGFVTIYNNSGGLEQATVAAAEYICFPSPDAVFGPFMLVKSVDNANAAVAQGADRVLYLIFRRYLGGS